jgi:hypothetical protein
MLEKIALDEDDVIEIIVRRLVGEYPLFKDKVSLAKAKQTNVTDQRNVTSVTPTRRLRESAAVISRQT